MSRLPERLNTRLKQVKASKDTPIVTWLQYFIPYLDQIYIKIRNELLNSCRCRVVTYTTDMNTDITGFEGELKYATNDDSLYLCTTTGKVAGTAVWKAVTADFLTLNTSTDRLELVNGNDYIYFNPGASNPLNLYNDAGNPDINIESGSATGLSGIRFTTPAFSLRHVVQETLGKYLFRDINGAGVVQDAITVELGEDGNLSTADGALYIDLVGDVDVKNNLTAGTIQADNGFTGTGAYTNFTITGGVITAAS